MRRFPEPHVEPAPIGERAKVWAACALFCAAVWALLFKVVLP